LDIPFGLHLLREFSLWSKPDMHVGHDPLEKYAIDGASILDIYNRRVIGFHPAQSEPDFFVHSSPSYPDFCKKNI
jgi:hypothetical protein